MITELVMKLQTVGGVNKSSIKPIYWLLLRVHSGGKSRGRALWAAPADPRGASGLKSYTPRPRNQSFGSNALRAQVRVGRPLYSVRPSQDRVTPPPAAPRSRIRSWRVREIFGRSLEISHRQIPLSVQSASREDFRLVSHLTFHAFGIWRAG